MRSVLFTFPEGKTQLVIGRNLFETLRMEDDQAEWPRSCSRKHALLSTSDGSVTIRDQASTNGLWVGRKVDEASAPDVEDEGSVFGTFALGAEASLSGGMSFSGDEEPSMSAISPADLRYGGPLRHGEALGSLEVPGEDRVILRLTRTRIAVPLNPGVYILFGSPDPVSDLKDEATHVALALLTPKPGETEPRFKCYECHLRTFTPPAV